MVHYYSMAQLARALDAEREGRPIDPHLRAALSEIRRSKSPKQCEQDDLDIVVTGFADHLRPTGIS